MEADDVSRDKIYEAYSYLKSVPTCRRTQLRNISHFLQPYLNTKHNFYVKDETTQESGSFKVRGMLNQIRKLLEKGNQETKLVTYSAGNYGRTFANMCQQYGLDGVVVMPEFAPIERSELIESKGVRTERCPTNTIESTVGKYVSNEGRLFMHPFDDMDLIYGHASFGLEMMEDLEKIDIALVCCGGGGILAGTALALKLCGQPNCKVYGVEPETANTMYQSFRSGCQSWKHDAKSIASGLSPPYAGKITFDLCKHFVEDIILVTDDEILQAMLALHKCGIAAEPSGSAGMAAVMFRKIPNLLTEGDVKNIVIGVTGGNCSKWDKEFINTNISK